MPNAKFRASYLSLSKYKEVKYGIGGVVSATPWKIRVVKLSHKVVKCHLIREIHFIPIHHSFGFYDVFLDGRSRAPKTPWIHPWSL